MPQVYIRDEIYNAFVKKYGIDNVREVINEKLEGFIKGGKEVEK